MKNNILLIGGGFIGNKLAKNLTSAGYKVSIADKKFGQDITDRESTDQLIRNFPGKKVILMAAIADLYIFEDNPELGLDVNVNGLINVALAATKYKKRLFNISTCCVYGNTKDLPSSEEATPQPSEIYAACKLAGEWIIKGFNKSYDLEYVNLRIATTYGPSMRASLAPARFINQILKGQPITIHGTGEQTRTLTYIDDEVEGIAAAIKSDVVNETINISTEEEVSVNDMVKIIVEEMGKNGEVEITHTKDRKGQTFVEQISAKQALQLVGWQAKVSYREGIRRTLNWMKSEGVDEFV